MPHQCPLFLLSAYSTVYSFRNCLEESENCFRAFCQLPTSKCKQQLPHHLTTAMIRILAKLSLSTLPKIGQTATCNHHHHKQAAPFAIGWTVLLLALVPFQVPLSQAMVVPISSPKQPEGVAANEVPKMMTMMMMRNSSSRYVKLITLD